jgi:hypothetical protein
MRLPLRRLAALDIEATGLDADSVPIEIGLCGCGPGSPETAWSSLIRPPHAWRTIAWSPLARRTHGLSAADLDRDGLAPDAVVDRFEAALDGRIPVSDEAGADGEWLSRLYAAAGRPPPPLILDIADAARGLTGLSGMDLQRRMSLAQAAATAAGEPVRHRAAADARRIARILVFLAERH